MSEPRPATCEDCYSDEDDSVNSKTGATVNSGDAKDPEPKKAPQVKVKEIKQQHRQRAASVGVGSKRQPQPAAKQQKTSSSSSSRPQKPQLTQHVQPPPAPAPQQPMICDNPKCHCQNHLPSPVPATAPFPTHHYWPQAHAPYPGHPAAVYPQQPPTSGYFAAPPPSVYQPPNINIPQHLPRRFSQSSPYAHPGGGRPASFHEQQYPQGPVYSQPSPQGYGPSPVSQGPTQGYPLRAPSPGFAPSQQPAVYQQPQGYSQHRSQLYDAPPQRTPYEHGASQSMVRQAAPRYPSAFVDEHYAPVQRSATAAPTANSRYGPPLSRGDEYDDYDHDRRMMPPPVLRPQTMAPRRESMTRPPRRPASVRYEFDEESVFDDYDGRERVRFAHPVDDDFEEVDDYYERGGQRVMILPERTRVSHAPSVRYEQRPSELQRQRYIRTTQAVPQLRQADRIMESDVRPRNRRASTLGPAPDVYSRDPRADVRRKIQDAEQHITKSADRSGAHRVPLTKENIKNKQLSPEPSNTGRRRQQRSGSYSHSGTSSADSGEGTYRSDGNLRLEYGGKQIEFSPEDGKIIIEGSKKKYHNSGSQKSGGSRGTMHRSMAGVEAHDRTSHHRRRSSLAGNFA